MKLGELREIVKAARVDPSYYSFDGDRHEALCILPAGQTWHVFLSERGQRYEDRTFDSEDDACTYFLRRLFELWQPR